MPMGPPHMASSNSQVYDFPSGMDDDPSGKGKKKRETKKKQPKEKEPKPPKTPKTPKAAKNKGAPSGQSYYVISSAHSFNLDSLAESGGFDSIESTIMSVSMNAASPADRPAPTPPHQIGQHMESMPMQGQPPYVPQDSEAQPSIQMVPAMSFMPQPAEEKPDIMREPSAPYPSAESSVSAPQTVPESAIMENPSMPAQSEDVNMAPMYPGDASAEEKLKVEQEGMEPDFPETPVGKKSKAKKPKSSAKKSKAKKDADFSMEGEGESMEADMNDEVM